VNRSFFLSLAVVRTRSRPEDMFSRLGVRHMPCWLAFSLALPLRSTDSAPAGAAAFAGFNATMGRSDFSGSCIIGSGLSPSRCGPLVRPTADPEISRFPDEARACMLGSRTARDRQSARASALRRVAFRCQNGVGVPIDSFAAQYPAYMFPCQRFDASLAAQHA